jgi:peptide/nickel transport system substrate-binding protein
LPYDGGVVRPLLCTALVALAAGCGGTTADGPTAVPTAGAGRAATDVVTIAYADPRARSTVERGIDVIVALFSQERLVTLGRDGRAQPRLAERWEVSPDGLTWRFHLRQGLIFQDGEPVVAAAVQAAIAPPAAPGAAGTLPGLRDLAAVEAPSPSEVVLRLRRPNAFLLEALGLAPIGSSKGAGAGPFRLDARTTGKAVLGRFKGFHGGRATLETVTIAEYPSQREAWSAMLRGDVDVLYDIAPQAFEFVKESPNAHVASFLRPYVTALTYNMAHPVLRRREVRRALSQAIDRQAVIEAAVGGRGIPAADHVFPHHWARDAAAPPPAFDVDAARSALERAGLRRGKGPTPARLTFTCLVQADPVFERLALALQRQLLAADVDMQLEALPLPEFQERLAAGRFDVFLTELIASHGLGFSYMIWHSGPGSPFFRSGYTGADAALDRLRAARTDDEVRAAVHGLQRTMAEDPPATFLYWGQASRAVSRRFALPPGEDQDILRSIERWRIAGSEPGSGGSSGRDSGAGAGPGR